MYFNSTVSKVSTNLLCDIEAPGEVKIPAQKLIKKKQPVMPLPVQQIVVPLPPPNANDHEDKSHGQFLLAITNLLQSVLHKNNIQIEKLPNF